MARLAALLALGALAAPAAASAYTPRAVHYTGAIEGRDAFVGIVKRGDRFRAYVSDAFAKSVTLSVWFRGALGPGAHVSASAHGVALEADLARRSATGTMTLPDGRTFRFLADSGFGGGLIERSYSYAGERYLSGWIVLRDKRVRGRPTIHGTAFDGSSESGPGIRPTPPLGTQIAEEQRPALCSRLNEDLEAVRFQRGKLLHQSGVWELRLNRGRGSGAAYRRLSQAIGWVDQQVFELERYSAKVC